MSNENFIKLLVKLIELKPEFEDEKGKGIKILGTNIYVKNGVIILVILLLVIIYVSNDSKIIKILTKNIDF